MKKLKYLLAGLILVITGVFTISCEDSTATMGDNYGKLSIKITDAPMPYDQFMEVNVTIDRVEMRKRNHKGSDNVVVLSDVPFTTNMLDLVNGITKTLTDSNIPTGDYDMIKLYMSSTNMTLKNGTSFNNDMGYDDHDNNWGSGMMQGGMMMNEDSRSIDIPMDPYFTLENGMMETFLLDLDINQSFEFHDVNYTNMGDHRMMDMSGYSFVPVMRFVQMSEAGTIQGTVQFDNTTLADATVYLMQNGSIYTTTHTDANGNYKFIGIPEGSYEVNVELEGYMIGDDQWDNQVQMSPGNISSVNCGLIPDDN